MKPQNRKILNTTNSTTTTHITEPPSTFLQPTNNSTLKKQLTTYSATPFDSSMALTLLVLLTALFFMGFFSVYLRRFSHDEVFSHRRRRRQSPPPAHAFQSIPRPRLSHRNGLDSSAVRSLPVFSYGGGAGHWIDCPICLSEFEERERVKMIPHCRHVFHVKCIDTWLSSHVTCPLCRTTELFLKEGCLDVVQGGVDQGVRELEGTSTEGSEDTWRVGLRRTSSCSSLAERVVLRRSSSF